MTTVAAVIPHWNRRELLVALLENLRGQTRRFDQIIVADNGSTDGSAESAEQAGARVVRLGSNRGFAAAVNRGIEAAHTDWIAILNNDVTLEPPWLETLLAAASLPSPHQDDFWFATGKILKANDPATIDATFDEVSRAGCAWRCGSGRPDASLWNRLLPIRMAPMTAAIFRRDLFTALGTLDESFESYLEDIDFGLRCAAARRRGLYVPAAVARHIGSATSGEWNKDTVRCISRNQVLLVRKHLPAGALLPVLAGQLLWGLVACRHGRGLSFVRGKWQGLFSKSGCATHPDTWPAVKTVVEESERHIFELQQEAGFDPYWRAYFWLSRR